MYLLLKKSLLTVASVAGLFCVYKVHNDSRIPYLNPVSADPESSFQRLYVCEHWEHTNRRRKENKSRKSIGTKTQVINKLACSSYLFLQHKTGQNTGSSGALTLILMRALALKEAKRRW